MLPDFVKTIQKRTFTCTCLEEIALKTVGSMKKKLYEIIKTYNNPGIKEIVNSLVKILKELNFIDLFSIMNNNRNIK